MEDLFSSLLGGTISETFGGGRRFRTTLRDGTYLGEIGGSYEPRHVLTEMLDGVQLKTPWPRILLRRDHLKAAGVVDLQRGMVGSTVEVDGEVLTLDNLTDDGFTFVEGKLSDFTESAPSLPPRSYL